MRQIGVYKVAEGSNANAIRAYIMMHGGRRIKVEWGIGHLKCKFRRFQKPFDNTKPRFNHFFRAAAMWQLVTAIWQLDTSIYTGGVYLVSPAADLQL
jgi:hypothetical protein